MLIVLLVSADFLVYLNCKYDYQKQHSKQILKNYPFQSYTANYKSGFYNPSFQFFEKFFSNKDLKWYFRPFCTDKNNTKAPVIIFGCSYAYGWQLENNQTFHYKLSELTDRNVYNFSLSGCGIQHMFFFLENNIDGLISGQKPEYAVFIYIPSHLRRLQKNIFPSIQHNGINLKYDIKNDKLKLQKHSSSFLYKTFIVKKSFSLIDKIQENYNPNYKNKSYLLAKKIFLESKKNLEEKYPGIKFIILNFQTENDTESNYELPFFFDELKKDGFIIVNSGDLAGRKFRYNSEDMTKDGYHPSEAAWDMILPKFIKETGM